MWNKAEITTIGKAKLKILNLKTGLVHKVMFSVVKENLFPLIGLTLEKTFEECMNLANQKYEPPDLQFTRKRTVSRRNLATNL